MKTKDELLKRFENYKGIEYFYDENIGIIAWQVSTGENVELLFIESVESNKGHGKTLIKEMVKRISPYNSVFVFRLASNENAGKFYRSLGFEETLVDGLYTVSGVLGIISYKKLSKMLE